MKGIAVWIWIVASVALGMIVFVTGITVMIKSFDANNRQSIISQYSYLFSKVKTMCFIEGIGGLYHYEILVPESIRAIYMANQSDELPPSQVSVLISKQSSAVGNYFCIKFFDENIPRCEKIACSIKMTYIGSPSMKSDLFSMISKVISGTPIYKYRLTINKTDEKFVTIEGVPFLGEPPSE